MAIDGSEDRTLFNGGLLHPRAERSYRAEPALLLGEVDGARRLIAARPPDNEACVVGIQIDVANVDADNLGPP